MFLSFTFDLLCYGVEGAPGWPSQDTGDRRLTAIVYLNPSWEAWHGGCLRVWQAGKEGGLYVDVEPRSGVAVLFLSGCMEHQVLPTAPEGPDRVAYTAWFY
jgi:SM-20-related protein